jgi:hypothetical protein
MTVAKRRARRAPMARNRNSAAASFFSLAYIYTRMHHYTTVYFVFKRPSANNSGIIFGLSSIFGGGWHGLCCGIACKSRNRPQAAQRQDGSVAEARCQCDS